MPEVRQFYTMQIKFYLRYSLAQIPKSDLSFMSQIKCYFLCQPSTEFSGKQVILFFLHKTTFMYHFYGIYYNAL